MMTAHGWGRLTIGRAVYRLILGLLLVALAALPTAMASSDKPQNQDKHQVDLDRHYPFIEQGAEPPGKSVPYEKIPALSRWEGQKGWRTRHGQAVVRWDLGKPSFVSEALFPDGTRGEVRHTLDHGYGRRSSGEKRWIYGTIDIRPDEVAFTDSPEQPVYTPPAAGSEADLERDLANDHAFLTALKDDTFAHALYIVLHNREFVRAADLQLWLCGDRQAAHLVAGLRQLGESYHDFYLRYDFDGVWPDDRPQHELRLRQIVDPLEGMLVSASSPKISIGVKVNGKLIETEEQADEARQQLRQEFERRKPEVEVTISKLKQQLAELADRPNSDVMLSLRDHLTRLGWRSVNQDDERRMGDEAMQKGLVLLADIKRLEQARAGEPGVWWGDRSQASRQGFRMIAMSALDGLTPDERAVRRGLRARIDALAATGRVNEQAYSALCDRDQTVQHRIGGYAKP